MTTMPMMNADPALFDPLGRTPTTFEAMLAALPDQLKHRLKDARFGIYNGAPASAEPTITAEDEALRMVYAGEAVMVDAKGELVAPPKWEPPVKIEGEDAFYAVLVEFGGEQTVAIPVNTPDGWTIDVRSWRPSEEQIAFICMHVK